MRFLFAGGAVTLLHWAVLAAGLAAGVEPLAATVLGSAMGAVGNYWMQRRWVFGATQPHATAIWRYALSCGLATLLNALWFVAGHRVMGWAPLPAQIIATGLVAVTNYLLYKIWVFHEQAG